MIGAACITNRMKKILQSLLPKVLPFFIPGRYLEDNIRLTFDLTEHLNVNNELKM